MPHRPPIDRRQVLGAGAAGLLLPVRGVVAEAVGDTGFVWGVAASAAQTESRQGRGRSNWDVFADTPGKIEDGSTNVRLTEFDTRYAEDFSILQAAGVPACRVSLAWPRIQPDGPGKASTAGLDHYDRMFDVMLRRGIEPWVTLFHWDVPTWAGDFRSRDIAARLAEYADFAIERLGDRVKHWMVFNEPNTVAMLGYGAGTHAPGIREPSAMMAAIHHQNLAIGLMTQAARARVRAGSRIGTTHNVSIVKPASDGVADVAAAARVDAIWNWSFLDPLLGKGYPEGIGKALASLVREGDLATISTPHDFLGVNYYASLIMRADPSGAGGPQQAAWPTELEQTALFPVEPAGLTQVLVKLRERYGRRPIYITETGFALDGETGLDGQINDLRRTRYLDSYLAAAAAAKAQGVDIRGLFYWSATDNWEWASGFKTRFGMIAVDMKTQRREPKRSLGKFGIQVRHYFPDAVRPARRR